MSAIKCKFENIILREESDMLLKEYNKLKELLDLKQNNTFLEQNEYQHIFEYDISNVKISECFIKKDSNYFYIYFHYDLDNQGKVKIIHLKREPYSFKFNDKNYIGFEKISLTNFLMEEYDKKKFVIIPKDEESVLNSIIKFMDYNFSEFEIKYDYKKRKITQDKLKLDNIYAEKIIYNAEDINFNFPYYVNIEETDFNTFKYYESRERNDFIEKILNYIDYHYYIAICGPYGSGKTVTLLKLIMDKSRRFFYVNLWTVTTTSLDELKEIFNYECIKLFRRNILELNEKKELSPDEKNMKEIFNCINDFKDKEKIFELISNIISLLKNMEGIYVIVLDQYSSKYDDNNDNIQKIISNIRKSQIKLIICSSMNNDDVKKYLSNSIDFNEESNALTYIYVCALIRVRNELIENETLSFQKIMSELGNLYLYFYLLKEKQRKQNDLDEFLENEKKNIQKEIGKFYLVQKEYLDKNKMVKDIIDIIYFINEKKIFFYQDLKKLILKLPLKFLEIKRQEISIFDLKQYAKRTKNIDLEEKIDNYDKKGKRLAYIASDTATCFFKRVDIIPKTQKVKLNYNDFNEKIKAENRINIYFLDYLFPFMQNILTNLIYNETMEIGKLLFSNFDGQTEGGFLEYFIIEYIKDKKCFFEYNINNFESIETIVENSYFIQNHSSRKPETKRNYEENEKMNISKTNKKKIKLRKNVILISQKQFTGKYYDCAFLFPLTDDEKDNKFKIASCQISKKKLASQRFYKEEHELILGNVKKNIENTFDIEIVEGYFFYIFSSQKLDKTSIEFCKKYNFEYVLFSPDEMKFNSKFSFNLSNSLITKNFPIQNSFSILPPEKFKTNKDNTLALYDEIKSFQQNLKYMKLSKENAKILNQFFGINEYIVLGFFNNKFNISKYGLWYDKDKKEISYKNSSREKTFFKELVFNNNENTENFVLIGLKNEILCLNYHTILEYFSKKENDKDDRSNNIKKND